MFSTEVYEQSWNNYWHGIEEEILEISDTNNKLKEVQKKYYDENGNEWGTSKRDYLYNGDLFADRVFYERSNDCSYWKKFEISYNVQGDMIREDIEIYHSSASRPLVLCRHYMYKYDLNGEWIQCTRVVDCSSDNPVLLKQQATIIVREIKRMSYFN